MGIFFPIGEFINDQLQFPRTLLPLKNFPHFSKQNFLPICMYIDTTTSQKISIMFSPPYHTPLQFLSCLHACFKEGALHGKRD